MDARVLEGILAWGVGRPAWQQMAIQHLLQGVLSDDDLVVLTDQCVDEARDSGSTSPEPVLVAPDDLSSNLEAAPVVQLVAISDATNVNALADSQTLPFAQTGITIVQGDNGSGKSGYARILKQVCRARSGQDVLPNAFSDESDTPQADVTFSLDGAPVTERWTRGEDLDAFGPLVAVSVYDSRATSIYINKNNDVAYRPYGLDIYDRLVAACEEVREELAQRVAAHGNAKPNLDDLVGDHPVGQFVQGLSSSTTEAQVNQLAGWTDVDAESLRTARAALADLQRAAPRQVAETKRAQSRRVLELATRLRAVISALADDAVADLGNLRADAKNARDAADAAARASFEDAPLSGVGSDAWRRLWDAARAYSLQHAYPDEPFPVAHDEARCVLCQQELTPDAGQRLRAFEDFVTGELAAEAKRVEAERDEREESVRSLDLSVSEALIKEIEDVGGPTEEKVGSLLSAAQSRMQAVLEPWDDVSALSQLRGLGVVTELDSLAEGLDSAASELEAQEEDEARTAAIARVTELEARERFTARREDVLHMIAWHKENDALQTAKAGISTNAISSQSRRVTEELVSDRLLEEFGDRLRALGAGGLPVRLKPLARAGQMLHQLELVGASADAPPGEVLSEGERSVVALAAFFAETALAPTPSAIVLDDPVTSLDHEFRERVARHIFREAEQRQVIVFTHDQVFTSELIDIFDNNARKDLISHYSVTRAGDAGLVEEGLPWALQSVNERIKRLNERCADARQLWQANEAAAYEDHAKRTLALLREAWERAVEEVALGGAVKRFSRQVHTKPLSKAVNLTLEDVAAIEAGMGLTSTQQHDQAPAAAQPVPKPEQLEQLVADLKAFCKEYRNR